MPRLPTLQIALIAAFLVLMLAVTALPARADEAHAKPGPPTWAARVITW
jgi:hypothetical protein